MATVAPTTDSRCLCVTCSGLSPTLRTKPPDSCNGKVPESALLRATGGSDSWCQGPLTVCRLRGHVITVPACRGRHRGNASPVTYWRAGLHKQFTSRREGGKESEGTQSSREASSILETTSITRLPCQSQNPESTCAAGPASAGPGFSQLDGGQGCTLGLCHGSSSATPYVTRPALTPTFQTWGRNICLYCSSWERTFPHTPAPQTPALPLPLER